MTPGSVPSGPTINTNIHDVNRYLLRDRNGGMKRGKATNVNSRQSLQNFHTKPVCKLEPWPNTLCSCCCTHEPVFVCFVFFQRSYLCDHIDSSPSSLLQNGSLPPTSTDWPVSGYSSSFSLSSSDGDSSGTHPEYHPFLCGPAKSLLIEMGALIKHMSMASS